MPFSRSQIIFFAQIPLHVLSFSECNEMLSDDNKKLQFLRSITVVLFRIFKSSYDSFLSSTCRGLLNATLIDEVPRTTMRGEEKENISKLMELINFLHAIKASTLNGIFWTPL